MPFKASKEAHPAAKVGDCELHNAFLKLGVELGRVHARNGIAVSLKITC